MDKDKLALNLTDSADVEITPEYADMDRLALSEPLEFIAKYNTPKEWILEQEEAEKIKAISAPANLVGGVGEKIQYGVGEALYNIGRSPSELAQLGTGIVSGAGKVLFPHSTDTALDRLYKNIALENAKNRDEREKIVTAFTGGDSDWVNWVSGLTELGLMVGGGVGAASVGASAARRGVEKLATTTAKGVAMSPSKVRRAASIAAAKGARSGQIASTIGLTFAQEGGSAATEKVREYIAKTGDTGLTNYDPLEDSVMSLAVGAINSAIEVGFGVERFIPEFWGTSTNFNRAARRFLEGAAGEGLEEFTQNITTQLSDIISGYKNDIDWGEAWNNAIMGAVLGGAAGSGMYYINRRRMANRIANDYGMDYKKAAGLVDDMLGTGIEATTNELSARSELVNERGSAWDRMVTGVKTAMGTVDFGTEESRENQAKAFARTNASIAMRFAQQSGLSTDEFLDIAEFETMNNGQNLNMVFIKPLGSVQDIDNRIQAQDEIINRQKELKKTGAEDKDTLRLARQRKAILQKAKAIKQYNDKEYQEQIKANTTPETAQEIETATKDVESVKGVTQAEFDSKVDTENLTSAEKSKRYGNAVLKSILPTKTDFDAVMVDPMYANAKQAIIAVADRINSFIKAHRTYGLKTDIANALKKMQTVNQGNFIDSVTTPDLDGVDVIAENAFLYHFLFSDATTIQTYLDSYITRAEDSLNQKKGKLSKKDLVGQSFKATDSAMQTQAQVIGAEYTSIYNEDGSYADKNVMAVMLSYQNQFVQEQRKIPTAEEQTQAWKKAEEITNKVLEGISDEEKALSKKTGAVEIKGKNGTIYSPVKSEGDIFIKLTPQIDDVTHNWVLKYQTYARNTKPSSMLGGYGGEFGLGSTGFGRSINLDSKEEVETAIKQIVEIYGKDNVFFGEEFVNTAFSDYQEEYKRPKDIDWKNKEIRDIVNELWGRSPQMLEQFDLADENARLDDIYPAYDGETIEIFDYDTISVSDWASKNIEKQDSFETDEGIFTNYKLVSDNRNMPTFTVFESKDGWIVRNAYIPESEQGKGVGTNFYKYMNLKSIEATGKPLRSTQPRTLNNGTEVFELSDLGHKLWDSLVRNNLAVKKENGTYVFNAPKERTVYNSNGDRIAKSKEALTNFWRWFGDSKVVDEQGRPLVVYHASQADFDTFDKKLIGTSTGKEHTVLKLGGGFYFANVKKAVSAYGNVRPMYLSIKNPIILGDRNITTEQRKQLYDWLKDKKWRKDFQDWSEIGSDNFFLSQLYYDIKYENRYEDFENALKQVLGTDGLFYKNFEYEGQPVITYLAFEPNQIKSVDNRGTYSADTGNIYYQAAYAGSRVDYDVPSLKAIGSGEGGASHGWGLYYALDKNVAERYRYAFTQSESNKYYEDKLNDLYTSLIDKNEYGKATIIESLLIRHTDEDIDDMLAEGTITQKDVDWFRSIEDKYLDKTKKEGQVHEVDIPEMDFLLDEQKGFSEQSSFVQEKIQETLSDVGIEYIKDINLESKTDFISNIKKKLGQEAADIMSDIYDLEIEYKNTQKENKELDAAWDRWRIFELENDTKGFDPNIVYSFNNITGEEIYDALVEKLGTAKKASQALEKHGIKGITYEGGMDKRCFVIFNPKDVKVLRKKFDAYGNVLFQSKKANGFYDPELGVIVLGRNMNEMTLPHEMQHYWLDKIFNIYKRAKSGELQVRDEWLTETKALFDMLGIDENQTQLTQGQQEKFARMSEAYLTGIGVTGDMNATFKEYQQWVPEKYKSILNLGYLSDDGKIEYPFLDQGAVDFFNKWYANYSLPSLATSPERQEFVNPEDENGEVLPVSIKEMNNRDKEFGNDAEEQVKTDQRLYNTLDENMPTEIKVEADGQKVVQASRSNFLKESEKQQRRWFERKSRDTEAQLAQDYIEKNPEHAKEVIFGDPELIPNDTGIDRATLINAYMALNNITPESEDWATLHTNIAINQSLAGTQLALSNNTSYRTYLDALREIENAREMKAATNYAGAKQGAVERFNRDIQRFVDEELPKVLATAPNTEARDIALKSLFERARTKFSGNTTGGVLNQMDFDYARGQKGASAAFTRWAVNQIKKDAGAKLNGQEQAKLLNLSAKAQQAVIDLDDRDTGKAVAGAQEIRKWQVEKDKLMGVKPQKFSLFGDYAPRAMLASFNTLVVSNIPSTAMNTAVVRILESGIFGKNEVSKSLTDSEIKRIKAIYGATAMNLAQMEKPTSPSLLHGEKYSSSGQKWYDPFTILGKEDNWFRVPTFVNTLARIASQDAKATGKSADEVFKEYCRLENQSDAAKLARKQALAVSNMAVFTQDGALARSLNGIRDWINQGSRALIGLDPKGFGLGNLLSPFLKTGANIAEMGIRGSLAPITTISALAQKWRSGKAIDPMKKLALAMDWTYFLLSSVMVSLLAALTSDDDEFYTEPYEMGKAYDPDRPYDSINIAGVWIDLDFFGPFAIPIRTGCRLVQQWKKDNLSAIYKGYGQGLKYAAMDTPLLESVFNNQMSYAAKKPEDWATGYLYTQANKLVPSQVKPLSRAISRGTETQLDMGWSGKVIDRKFHRNYGFDAQELTTQDLIDIFTTKITWQPKE